MATQRDGKTTDFGNQKKTRASDKIDAYSIYPKETDSPDRKKETSYRPEWQKWHGYYREGETLKRAINKLASWTFGRGIKPVRDVDKKKLKKIVGTGKDTARSVLKNQLKTALICGDSFGHIITDSQGRLTNLKPLNPGTMKTIYNKGGIIKRYEQTGQNGEKIKYEPDEILHLMWDRIADEMHGIPFIESLVEMIEAKKEALDDLRKLYHRNIEPINWIEVETDDKSKLAGIESTINEAYKNTENIVIPKGVIDEVKSQKTGQYTTLDSLPYLKFLLRQFVTGMAVPEVVMGWGEQTTEASAKIIYLAFQQTIEDMQLFIEGQLENQLNLEIDLEFPASIESGLMADERKDGKENIQKNEVEANDKGKT